MLSLLILIGALILGYLYIRSTQKFDYWEKQGIKTRSPCYPFVGTLWKVWKRLNFASEWLLIFQVMVVDDLKDIKTYGKLIGLFEGTRPYLFCADPDIIRDVFIKNFDHFVNRREAMFTDEYMKKMLSALQGDEWKEARKRLSPMFSSGKIKNMSILMSECAETLVSNFKKSMNNEGIVDLKEHFGAFTMDVIATCAFGTKIDSLGSPHDPFVENAKKAFLNPRIRTPLVLLLLIGNIFSKRLSKMLISNEVLFFARVSKSIADQRRKEKLRERGDMIDLLLELQEEEQKECEADPTKTPVITEEFMVAQMMIFFLAGFDTSATTLTMVMYSLALNPDVQDKVVDEIKERVVQYGGINHEMVNDCPYLDQVIQETLRLYPPAFRTERTCNKPCEIRGVKFEKGVRIAFPIYAIHHNPEFYEDPEEFRPDRFAQSEKVLRHPMIYLPFGHGPRNCIGMRFALTEIKLALCHVLSQLKASRSPQTQVPVETAPSLGFFLPVNVKVKLEARE
ncbi:unnamed protein product [Darwinula stevensoni]|uniref:Cytochrome P450 n=1 Tax=Darwinula stevensoni TaxID=69355 RepID=A0A7R9A694_9CRUS|nr:unnamed protein product [Darwinula stevensoni]CAG0888448.1 unnamed protein product [Darwinula stevensoni]